MNYTVSDKARRNIYKFILKKCGVDLRTITRLSFQKLEEFFRKFVKDAQGKWRMVEQTVKARNLRTRRRGGR